jgi:hypothetical protein
METPLACTLTESEMRERRREILDRVRGAAREVVELPDGFAYRFEPESEILAQLARLVDLERQCCEFLTFRIVVGARKEPFSLEITGPAGAKPMIADFFGS